MCGIRTGMCFGLAEGLGRGEAKSGSVDSARVTIFLRRRPGKEDHFRRAVRLPPPPKKHARPKR
jgi:hypothetical protein